MSTHTKGPWFAHPYNGRMGSLISHGDISKGETIATVFAQINPAEGKANAHLVETAPELLEDAKSTNQGYDWFREQLEHFKEHQGSWTLEIGDDWADSLIAHINSRQIGTRAAIDKAEGR